ncbi:unnamed protein product [Strongylus vulgaris]|uniref:Glutamine synthetase n=1 Tax=Strongylus vulgaris TaxID=40348 RepID=A0A3P7M3B2_STRVU|nr:unnamed protein product [Strongylus vulgaris]
MRSEGGIKAIEAAMTKLAATHKECIRVYDPHDGEDNKYRLTGKHETSSYDKFSWGVANRAASVRLPRSVVINKKASKLHEPIDSISFEQDLFLLLYYKAELAVAISSR